jgi:hypothetical protein
MVKLGELAMNIETNAFSSSNAFRWLGERVSRTVLGGCPLPRVLAVSADDLRVFQSRLREQGGAEATGSMPMAIPASGPERTKFILRWLKKTEAAARRAGLAAPLLLVPLALEAQSEGYIAVDALPGMTRYALRADGSLEIVFEGGLRVVIPGDRVVKGGQRPAPHYPVRRRGGIGQRR